MLLAPVGRVYLSEIVSKFELKPDSLVDFHTGLDDLLEFVVGHLLVGARPGIRQHAARGRDLDPVGPVLDGVDQSVSGATLAARGERAPAPVLVQRGHAAEPMGAAHAPRALGALAALGEHAARGEQVGEVGAQHLTSPHGVRNNNSSSVALPEHRAFSTGHRDPC